MANDMLSPDRVTSTEFLMQVRTCPVYLKKPIWLEKLQTKVSKIMVQIQVKLTSVLEH